MPHNHYKATGTIATIVDGPGDREAVKCLLRNWLNLCDLAWRIETPIIGGLATKGNVEKNVRRAMQYEPDVILLITDSEERCRKLNQGQQGIAEILLNYRFPSGNKKAKKVRYAVVAASECYEAWLLAASPNFGHIADTRYSHMPIDDQKNPYKDELEQIYGHYSPTTRQGELTNKIDLTDENHIKQIIKSSASFDKLIRVLEAITGCNAVSRNKNIKLKQSANPQMREITAFL